jgi:hypothetical protein
VAVDTQGVSQAPVIALIVLGSGGSLAFAVTHRAFGVYRIDAEASVEQLLDRHGQGGAERSEGLAQALPAFGCVLEAQLQDQRAF